MRRYFKSTITICRALVHNSSHVVGKIDKAVGNFVQSEILFVTESSRELWTSGFCGGLTGDVVAQYPRRDNSAVRAEEILQILLRHVLRQAAYVQIRAFDRLAARSRVRHLEKKNGKSHSKKIFSLRSRRTFVGLSE